MATTGEKEDQTCYSEPDIGIEEAAIVNSGEPSDALVALLYQELRRIAAACLRRERPNHTLQPTALVNEAWLRLAAQSPAEWNDRVRFLAASAHLMREVLIDYARRRNRGKRGGGMAPIRLEDAGEPAAPAEVGALALDEALTALERIDRQQAQIVELRYFAGLNNEEAAQVLGVSTATVKRDWRMAKAWLRRELSAPAVHEP